MFQPEKSKIVTGEDARDFFLSLGYIQYSSNNLNSAKYCLQKRLTDVPECKTNDHKVCINVEIYDTKLPITHSPPPHFHRSIEFDLTAEAPDGTWFKLSAYGLFYNEVEEKIKSVEERLVNAWRVCYKR